jgi:hypothetical protein
MAILSAVALVLQISLFQQHLMPAAAAKAAEPVASAASAAAPAPAGPAASLPATPLALPDAPEPVAARAAEPSAALPSAAPSASAAPTPASLTGIYIAPDQNLLQSKPYVAPVEASKHAWLALSITEHTAAAFDAWTTRRSIESGNVEVDPLLKPFAHSDAVYGAIQGTPIVFDFLSRRMQRSDSRFIRRFWWVPQAAMASVSIYSGTHNMSITR